MHTTKRRGDKEKVKDEEKEEIRKDAPKVLHKWSSHPQENVFLESNIQMVYFLLKIFILYFLSKLQWWRPMVEFQMEGGET